MACDSTPCGIFLSLTPDPVKPIGVIREVKLTAAGERQEFACTLLARSPAHAVVFHRLPAARRVGRLTLPSGTETFGYFWAGRPYNVYHWLAPDGRTLGFYVNLSGEVRLGPQEVRWQDLALDLLFSPDGGRVEILDEREAAALPPPLRRQAEAARDHVLTHRDEILTEVRGATEHLRGLGERRTPRRRTSPRSRPGRGDRPRRDRPRRNRP